MPAGQRKTHRAGGKPHREERAHRCRPPRAGSALHGVAPAARRHTHD